MGITKYVETSHLPHKNDSIIDWKKSVGYRCSFIYGDITGELEIIDYIPEKKSSKIKVKYNDNEKLMSTSSFLRGTIGELLKIHTADFKYNIGDILNQKNQDIEILDRWHVKEHNNRNRKHYKYRCLKCGYINESTEAILKQKKGCPACKGRIVVPRLNDITVTAPWMINYFPGGIEEARQYTPGMDTLIQWVCPCCKNQVRKPTSINQLYYNHSCGCKCDTSISFPERVMYNILEESGIDFIHTFSRKDMGWCERYRYDFYLPDFNCIIETHGLQHYGHGFEKVNGKTLKEEQENDKNKKLLALSNGIKYYYEIDCRYSDLDWILNSCVNSGLFTFLNVQVDNLDKNQIVSNVFANKRGLCEELIESQGIITKQQLKNKLNISMYFVDMIIKSLDKELQNKVVNFTDKPCIKHKGKKVSLFINDIYAFTFNSFEDAKRRFFNITGDTLKTNSTTKYIDTGRVYKKKYTFYTCPESEVCYASSLVTSEW